MYFCYFVIISPWKRTGPFIWTNLNSLHQRMFCAKFGWNWPSGSGEKIFIISSMFFFAISYICNYLPLEKSGALHLNKLESGSVVLEKKIFLISSMYFHYFVYCEWRELAGSRPQPLFANPQKFRGSGPSFATQYLRRTRGIVVKLP